MKLGAISDVHANLEALTAVLNFFRQEGVDQVISLGDVVGYGPDPEACIELLQQAQAKVVAGNHDWGTLGKTPISHFNHLAVAALKWTQKRLKPEHLLFLSSLPLTMNLNSLHLVHASPSAPQNWEYIFTIEEAFSELRACPFEICLVGHTHRPLIVEKPPIGPVRTIPTPAFSLQPDARYLINIGSVGQPRDGDPRACCALIDLKEKRASFHRIPYDILTTQKKMFTFGLPRPLIERLELGI
ncbi:MAG: metallophosphoesterase family protein [candidate division WOR-3 bacterium]